VPELDRIVLKDTVGKRPFASSQACRKTAITTRILGLVHELCNKQINVTKRDLFYTDVKLFEVRPAVRSCDMGPAASPCDMLQTALCAALRWGQCKACASSIWHRFRVHCSIDAAQIWLNTRSAPLLLLPGCAEHHTPASTQLALAHTATARDSTYLQAHS
jgi:hypothetical protein